MSPPSAAIAVDWSGALDGGKHVWLAHVIGEELVTLQGGWKADELVRWLVDRAARDPGFVVGFDFAFGFPAWFATRLGQSMVATWAEATTRGEAWLRDEEPPFWGRQRKRPPAVDGQARLRRTDTAHNSKSVFQIGGAGHVGTGSIRGMPLLARLRSNGFAIWPLDPVVFPLVIEIYPRVLTGSVVKSDPAARRSYLDRMGWPKDPELRLRIGDSEDAFDAAVSARKMADHLSNFVTLPPGDEIDRLEGRIWTL